MPSLIPRRFSAIWNESLHCCARLYRMHMYSVLQLQRMVDVYTTANIHLKFHTQVCTIQESHSDEIKGWGRTPTDSTLVFYKRGCWHIQDNYMYSVQLCVRIWPFFSAIWSTVLKIFILNCWQFVHNVYSSTLQPPLPVDSALECVRPLTTHCELLWLLTTWLQLRR